MTDCPKCADMRDHLAAEHILRVQIERERLETARQATRLLNENLRLREALADIARGDYSDPLCQRTPEQRARDALAERDEAIVDALVKERTPQNPQRKPLPRREKK